jgi:multiple sugar transport system substrate-binding protein
LVVLAACVVAAGCGGGGGKGPAQLSFYVFPEPSGSFEKAAKECSQQSRGAYTITVNTLPSDADGQRQQLVRRLSAHDDSIDIIGMDVIWTAEFAQAGWIKPWTGARAAQVTRGTLPVPIKTATYKGRLWGAPANSNTQLLWYRKDLVKTPPKTWAQMIAMAAALNKQGKPHLIEVQGRQYEGLTVWFNSLNASAGGSTLTPTGKVTLGPPAVKSASVMKAVATGPGADPGLSQAQEDQARLGFEKGGAAFEINYQDLQEHGLRPLARRQPRPARPRDHRRDQLRRRRLHEALGAGVRGRGLPAQSRPPEALRAQGRPAAHPQRAL